MAVTLQDAVQELHEHMLAHRDKLPSPPILLLADLAANNPGIVIDEPIPVERSYE